MAEQNQSGTPYTVTGSGSRRRVAFNCQRCGAELASPLAEAGQRFPCPTCKGELTTPGERELRREREQQRAAAANRAEADAAARRAAAAKLAAVPPTLPTAAVAAPPAAVAATAVPVGSAAQCANCGRAIGRLERAVPYGEHIVCGECYNRLTPTVGYATPTAAAAQPAPVGRACPSCGSARPAVRRAKGSRLVMIVLLLLWLVPGILYMVIYSGYIYVCPDCGYKFGDAT